MSQIIPTVSLVGDDALTNQLIERNVTELVDDVTTTIGKGAFYNMKSLTKVVFTKATATQVIGDMGAFMGCENLNYADFHAKVSFEKYSFRNCWALQTLILRSGQMCTAKTYVLSTNDSAKPVSPYIYVPAALVDSYKAALNWSDYANQFRALEDYTVDGTITGELDETKI